MVGSLIFNQSERPHTVAHSPKMQYSLLAYASRLSYIVVYWWTGCQQSRDLPLEVLKFPLLQIIIMVLPENLIASYVNSWKMPVWSHYSCKTCFRNSPTYMHYPFFPNFEYNVFVVHCIMFVHKEIILC